LQYQDIIIKRLEESVSKNNSIKSESGSGDVRVGSRGVVTLEKKRLHANFVVVN